MKDGNKKVIIMLVISVLCLGVRNVSGQDTWYGTVSGLHFMYNPAYTGSSGIPVMRASCYSFMPGNNFNLKSVYASFDGYSPVLHGGAGIWFSDDVLGDVMNDFRAGASYAYHLRAGKNLYINAGLAASVVNRGINRGSVILPGDYDQLNGLSGISSEVITAGNVTLFDLGTGITFAWKTWYGGFSVMHLTQPKLSPRQQSYNKLSRLYTVTAGTLMTPGKGSLTISPAASLMIQSDNVIIYLGAQVLYREIMCGLSAWHVTSGFTAAEPAIGWDTGSTKIMLSYSYVINGGDTIFKSTAIVRAGLSVSFGNVEKRRAIHVIKLPEL
jgi:type IX secretion system PorP/SprF family membrane protein